MTKPTNDVYTRITNRIVEQLEQGVRPWFKPWDAEHAAGRISRPLRHNGQPYNGINILTLWDSAETQSFTCPIWLTFKQIKDLGGSVRKGENSSPVVYASSFTKTEQDGNDLETERDVFFHKIYAVFNAEQCNDLPEDFYAIKVEPVDSIEPFEAAVAFFRNTGAEVREGGNKACYFNGADYVRMPKIETFIDAESHAATLAHEMVHWTKHPKRLNRCFGRKKWGDAGYAMEELVAEIGSAFLCADLLISPKVREDHAEYIATWIKVLNDDNRAIFKAASYASKATEYLHNLQPTSQHS